MQANPRAPAQDTATGRVPAKRRRPLGRRGGTQVMVALMAPVLVGFTALTVDVGRLYVRKQALSNGVDAAALAGGRELPNEEAAKNEVMRVAAANQIDTRQVRTQFAHRGDLLARTQDTSGGSPPNYLKVGATEPVPMTFARIFGIDTWPVDVSAAVAVSGGDKPVNTVPSRRASASAAASIAVIVSPSSTACSQSTR